MLLILKSESKVFSRYVKIAPAKLRRIAVFIKHKSVEDALFILKFSPHRGSKLLISLINSAYQNVNSFNSVEKSSVLLDNIQIDDGPFFKRFQPHAQGRSFPIKKRTSHIFIKVSV